MKSCYRELTFMITFNLRGQKNQGHVWFPIGIAIGTQMINALVVFVDNAIVVGMDYSHFT